MNLVPSAEPARSHWRIGGAVLLHASLRLRTTRDSAREVDMGMFPRNQQDSVMILSKPSYETILLV